MLVSRGHKWQDILTGYSIEQVEHLCAAARTNRRKELAELAVVFRAAGQFQKEDFQQFMDSLEEGPAAPGSVCVAPAAQKLSTPQQVQALNAFLGGGMMPRGASAGRERRRRRSGSRMKGDGQQQPTDKKGQ